MDQPTGPQSLKDLVLGATDNNLLLLAVTDLVNLLLKSNPLPVYGALFV